MKSVKNAAMYVLAALIVLAFFGVVVLLVIKGIPPENKDMFNLLLGALIAAFTAVVQYWFGSSKGSADKTEIMNKQNGTG